MEIEYSVESLEPEHQSRAGTATDKIEGNTRQVKLISRTID